MMIWSAIGRQLGGEGTPEPVEVPDARYKNWQGRQDSNPRPAVLETAVTRVGA